MRITGQSGLIDTHHFVILGCGHCTRMKPAYADASAVINHEKTVCMIARSVIYHTKIQYLNIHEILTEYLKSWE